MVVSRRSFQGQLAATASALAVGGLATPSTADERDIASASRPMRRWRYLLASSLYGYTKLAEILPEVNKTGASAIDLWPKVHGSQREELDEFGEEKFRAMLAEHKTTLGCLTQYKLGPFGLKDEIALAKRLGCQTIVTGAGGAKGLAGDDLKQAIAAFVEKMKPHLALAEEAGVTIAIENHSFQMIDSPESIRRLLDVRPGKSLGLAFAPYHLPQDPELLTKLMTDAGEAMTVFYAWQHGHGCMEKLPKEEELLQMPGRGTLDFGPLMRTLAKIDYGGWVEIFMHPFPRGIPILETTAAVTEEVNKAKGHLEGLER